MFEFCPAPEGEKTMAISHTPNADNTTVSAMNMTPLIDVLLVLLIMFVVTIPIAAHSVEVDVGPGPEVINPIRPTINKIAISQEDSITWNGERVTKAQLTSLLKASTKMVPEPELQFEPEAQASYQTSAEVLREIKFSGVTNFGFVGNEKYRQFASGE
jgi:biopolymer transport protein ExbD